MERDVEDSGGHGRPPVARCILVAFLVLAGVAGSLATGRLMVAARRHEARERFVALAADVAAELDRGLRDSDDVNAVVTSVAERHGVRGVLLRAGTGADAATFVAGSEPFIGESEMFEVGAGWSLTVIGDTPPPAGDDRTAIAVTVGGLATTAIVGAAIAHLAAGRARARRAARRHAAELARRATQDPLTGLANRTHVLCRLSALLAQAARSHTRVVVLHLDVDRFEAVNDALGHDGGDELLIAIARRLQRIVPEADTIGRMRADDFVILLEEHVGATPAELVARRVIDRMSTEFTLPAASTTLTVTCSIGLAAATRGRTAAELIRDADVALTAAQADGPHRAIAYHHQMGVEAERRSELEAELPRALAHGQLRLVYQPIHRLGDLSPIAVEALLRWDHPAHGAISPAEFVPMLERDEQIITVGTWVLREACHQLAAWHRDGRLVDLSVNVSARQLDDPSLVERVSAALRDSGLRATSLIVEITETALTRQPALAATRLDALRRLGVRVALDDFGSGYSSLAYLRQFPLDSIKIDRQFVTSIDRSAEARAVLSTLARLGRQLGLTVLAEGIETAEQLDELRRHRIENVQGYYLSRPLDPEEFERQVPPRCLATPASFRSAAPEPDAPVARLPGNPLTARIG